MADEERRAALKKKVEQRKKKLANKGTTAKQQDKEKEEAGASESKPDTPTADEPAVEDAPAEPPISPTTPGTSSLPLQSKLRSSSFRQGTVSPTGFPLSPEGETAPDIYRKQVARIEDLEKENKRLAKEAGDSEKRWQKAEEELADLREADRDGSDSQVEKLKSEIAALQRQNSQLQTAAASKRHGSSPSISLSAPPGELQAQLASKSATIETMELEISRLRAQAERQATAGGTDREQITALEEKLARSEQAAMKAQRELADLKRNLERTTERVVKEGSERTSAETKLRNLEREVEKLREEKAELEKKTEGLEKKVAALGTLHKENDSRSQGLRKDKERAEKEAADAKAKIEKLEAENAKLRKKDAAEGGGDDDGVDELEDEERKRMEKKIRDLESEVYDLRRGIWHQRRRDMEPGAEDLDNGGLTSPSGFTNIDLGGPNSARKASQRGFGDFFTNGINALTGGTPIEEKGGDDGFLDDDDMEFDEDAFKRAQEEDAKRRLERIKDIKRSLKNWEGWRLDLVDARRGGGGHGAGEVFEI
ncbi:uncharacterized protein F4822DRAFT_398312 [Hypoxylon trugodes]|uniref:uncharacterized protein n=1 Tax=Hypoxylon trugodes TaxID=326681 RepID=UPI00219DDB78|nr:uncharacterized protein F4822DRAFT_398312 [Hypoxylon trugodes]KAI1389438.1 hypothetical protein F4822DRAFT_398312 [Hypoxylon trugodes]